MSDNNPTVEAVPVESVKDDDKPKRKPKLAEHLIDGDGNPKLDHIELADAQAVADAIGGTVEPVGVAFHVATGD